MIAAKIKPDDLIKRLSGLQLGEAGMIVRASELMKLDIPEIHEIDIQARAEWLRDRLPFPCEIQTSATISDYRFTRLNSPPGR